MKIVSLDEARRMARELGGELEIEPPPPQPERVPEPAPAASPAWGQPSPPPAAVMSSDNRMADAILELARTLGGFLVAPRAPPDSIKAEPEPEPAAALAPVEVPQQSTLAERARQTAKRKALSAPRSYTLDIRRNAGKISEVEVRRDGVQAYIITPTFDEELGSLESMHVERADGTTLVVSINGKEAGSFSITESGRKAQLQ